MRDDGAASLDREAGAPVLGEQVKADLVDPAGRIARAQTTAPGMLAALTPQRKGDLFVIELPGAEHHPLRPHRHRRHHRPLGIAGGTCSMVSARHSGQ